MSPAMTYDIHSRGYLARAEAQFSRNDRDSLFYAAFELRSVIEARMQEYISEWDHISKKQKKGWQVDHLAQSIESAFQLGTQAAELVVQAGAGRAFRFFYTPVRPRLREIAQRLGDYLHAQRTSRSPSDPWWNEFRVLLQEGIAELRFSVSGTMLGPSLFKPGTRSDAHFMTELLRPEDENIQSEIGLGTVRITVNYHPAEGLELPPDAYLYRIN